METIALPFFNTDNRPWGGRTDMLSTKDAGNDAKRRMVARKFLRARSSSQIPAFEIKEPWTRTLCRSRSFIDWLNDFRRRFFDDGASEWRQPAVLYALSPSDYAKPGIFSFDYSSNAFYLFIDVCSFLSLLSFYQCVFISLPFL